MIINGSMNGNSTALPFELSYDAFGRLVLTEAEGRSHVGVEVVRAFPLSDPRRGIAICDAKGRELRWLPDLDALSAALIAQIETALARLEFVPVIVRILQVSSPVEPSEWHVETDRGRTSFVLNSEEDVHELDERRALITDAHGIRYLIPDVERLDAESRRRLERYL